MNKQDAKKEDLYKAKAEYYMQQLEDLQTAIMALEPFDDEFQQMVEMHHGYYAPENCTHCELKYPNHKPDCPVTKLREVLKKQEMK